MTLDTLGVELENRRGPRRVVPLAVAFEFRRVVLYVHPGRQEMLVHEPHHAFVRPHLGIQPSTAASHWGGAEVEEDRLSLGLRVLQDLIDVMAKLDWHGMLASGNLLNIAGPSPKPDTINTILTPNASRSEEHTSELQSRFDLVCRLLLE